MTPITDIYRGRAVVGYSIKSVMLGDVMSDLQLIFQSQKVAAAQRERERKGERGSLQNMLIICCSVSVAVKW